MTNLEGTIQLELAQLYSLRTWIEYSFKQVKNELGWTDYRLTSSGSIERWWEMVYSAYLLISIQANNFQSLAENKSQYHSLRLTSPSQLLTQFQGHLWWENGRNWNSALNNMRLIIQPYLFYCLLRPWLEIFNIPGFRRCFSQLIDFMNNFRTLFTNCGVTDFGAA